jgi:chromosome segregation ATPase
MAKTLAAELEALKAKLDQANAEKMKLEQELAAKAKVASEAQDQAAELIGTAESAANEQKVFDSAYGKKS